MNLAEVIKVFRHKLPRSAALRNDRQLDDAVRAAISILEKTAAMPPPPGGRNTEHFAGSVYGFGAYLTTRPGIMMVGESQSAAPMAEACKEYLTSFGAQDVEPDIPHANWAGVKELTVLGRAEWMVMAANDKPVDDKPRKPPEGASVAASPGFGRVEIKSADGTVRVTVDGTSISIDTNQLYISSFQTDDGMQCRSFLDPDLKVVMLS